MMIDLSDKSFEEIILRFADNVREYCDRYLSDREKVWQEQKLICGDNLWNGTVYTVENILILSEQKIRIDLSTCQYKDILFKKNGGADILAKNYDRNYLFSHVGVIVIPVTADNKYIFGVVGKDGYFRKGQICFIGGSLNYDESKISNLEDVRLFAARELREETRLNLNPEKLKLVSLDYYNYSYHFVFFLKIAIDSREVDKISKPGELSNLLAISEKEIDNHSNNFGSNYIQFYRKYLDYFKSKF